jgi:hypothetical protein
LALLFGLLGVSALVLGAGAVPRLALDYHAVGLFLTNRRADVAWFGVAVLAVTGCILVVVGMTAQ